MSNSNLVTIRVPAHDGNYSLGRSGRKIEMITIHHMAGVLSAEQCGNIFATAGRNASAHYGVGKDGEVGQYIDENNTSWANANWESNCRAVTVETSNCENGGNWRVSDTVLNKLIELVADISKRNNLGKLIKGQNLTWHSMYAITTCPGEYLLSKIDYIVEKANEINGYVEKTIQPVQPTKKSNEEIADEVIAGKWGNGEERYNRLTNAGYDAKAIQDIVNNKLLGTPVQQPTKDLNAIVDAVIRGEYGNGQDRVDRLKTDGYDPNEIQALVNKRYGI